ncbi:MAG: large repetitive protein, partial [Solirubrobacteraceae bacterium]|nr:large repetitive protein [Solirubrobacteraceae bacterium]
DLSRWGSWRNVSVIASNAHSGQRSLLADTGNGNAWTRRTLGAAPSTTTTTVWLRVPSSSLATAFTVVKLRTAADQAIAGVGISALRKLQLRNDVTATTTTGSAPALTLDAWHRIDFTATTAGTASTTLVRQDGGTVGVISATDVNLGSTPVGMVQLGELNTAKTFTAQWDDVSVTSP